ncbi:neuroguidin-B isoform X1 [Cinnamomum micranthum f. kanehirae]|uniref:Neuroguidin-B isoform X1 n=1 Tax=Cinnamomum micranthum f. kanehirae TaxID=337451 RepID=A0A3S3MW12_9MAGN|nr:neuroguidin-B isoform X1 [Cinnamomum micranthum f. kanehirae]
MGENLDSSVQEETPIKESPQLVALLKEMKVGLDAVRSKVQALTVKVRENHFPTADGISYLEVKHLLLLSYCQSTVYYLLRKAKGFSIEGHPVVRSLVEIRLFLEKIHPIDKKLQYQVQKLTRSAGNAVESVSSDGRKNSASQETEDLLKYRPNPDMLASKLDQAKQDGEGVYRPPKFAPTAMDEDKISKREKQALRKEKEALRQAKQSAYVKELIDDFEGRPEEVREIIGTQSRELLRYQSKMEDHARREEELFTRAPLSKIEKKKEKHLKKSRNGLLGLTDGFYDEIKTLPLEEDAPEQMDYIDTIRERKKSNKRKRKH